MDKYFRPKQMIDWFNDNKDNEQLVKSYGFSKAWNSDVRDNKDFFGYSLEGILRYLKDVLIYIKDIDPEYDPEVKIVEDYNNKCIINGESYNIDNKFIAMFIYKKESFRDTIADIKPEQLLGNDKLVYAGEGTNLPADCKSKSVSDMDLYVRECDVNIEDLKKSLEAKIKQKEEEFALEISRMKLAMAESMKDAYSEMMTAKTKVAKMESYFYRYLSYKGCTFELKKLCSGQSGTGSLVIWQKLRYLNEELPRLCALDESSEYIDFSDFTSFEKLLATNKYVRDFFLPSQKCCVAFQLSKSGTGYRGHFNTVTETTGSGRDTKFRIWLEYVETAYSIANWNKLGLFFRNGDNVYVAWLDKDKINIIGDSLFVTNSSEDSEIKADFKQLKNLNDYSDKSKGGVALDNLSIMDENNDKKISMYNKYMSRVYVVDILQGILDNNKDILELPDGQNVLSALVNKSYKDIIFNNADGYIENLKWKNFDEVYADFKLKDEDIKYGYDIYVLTNDGGKGRGRVNAYVDRTNDAKLYRGLNKINMIDFEDSYLFYRDIDKNDFSVISDNLKDWYVITKGELKDWYRQSSRIYLKVTYKDGSTKGYSEDRLYKLKDGTIAEHYDRFTEVDDNVYAYKIENFNDIVSMRFEFSFSNTDEYRRVEEPLEPRYSKSETTWDWHEHKYIPKQVNKVYEHLMDYYKIEIEKYGFVEDKTKRERKYYFYVRCNKSWSDSRANVQIEGREFICLKNIKSEHIDYMINHKFVLPYHRTFAESLTALLDIKNWLIENKKVK